MGNLNKVVYTDHQTVITADNLNAIQDSVIQNTSYTTCTTGASTAAKTAALTNFVLTTGSAVKVKFTNSNTAANPTLNVNSTGAKPIMQYGTTVAGTTATDSWDDGAVVEFVYDGTNWVMQGRNTIDAVSKANGGTFNGNLGINTADGTASTTGTSTLVLGNSTPTGTEGNSRGQVQLFSNGANYSLMRAATLTGNRTVDLPDAGGTVMVQNNDTISHNLIVDKKNGTASSLGDSYLVAGNSTPYGTAGNSRGVVQLYSEQSYYVNFYPRTLTANRSLYCPDTTGIIMTSAGGTFNGHIVVDRQDGTTSSVGESAISLGNNISEGTAKNSRGLLQLFAKNGYYTNIYPVTNSANRSIQLPDASGTIALQDVINKSTDSFFTVSSGYNVTSKYWYQTGKVVFMYLNIKKTDSSAFASSRINAGTIASGYRPMAAVAQMVGASNGVDSYMNRQCAAVIQADGTVYLDNYFASDVKTVYVRMSYLLP